MGWGTLREVWDGSGYPWGGLRQVEGHEGRSGTIRGPSERTGRGRGT